jgi:hypothetical protein
MFGKVFTKSLLAVAIIATITASSGCRTSVTGPEVQEGPAVQGATPQKAEFLREDLTQDGFVDASDLGYFAYAMNADVTNDGKVDSADQDRMEWAMGQSYPAELEGLDASELARAAFLIPCDFNNDLIIDASDLAHFASLWTMAVRADVNTNRITDDKDLKRIERAFGTVT